MKSSMICWRFALLLVHALQVELLAYIRKWVSAISILVSLLHADNCAMFDLQ